MLPEEKIFLPRKRTFFPEEENLPPGGRKVKTEIKKLSLGPKKHSPEKIF